MLTSAKICSIGSSKRIFCLLLPGLQKRYSFVIILSKLNINRTIPITNSNPQIEVMTFFVGFVVTTYLFFQPLAPDENCGGAGICSNQNYHRHQFSDQSSSTEDCSNENKTRQLSVEENCFDTYAESGYLDQCNPCIEVGELFCLII